jgi:hypothetical protein
MKERMKEPYEKGLANRSAPNLAPRSVRGEAKRKQGIRGLGIELRKDAIRMLTPYSVAESHMDGNDNASPRTILRSQYFLVACQARRVVSGSALTVPLGHVHAAHMFIIGVNQRANQSKSTPT